MVLTFLTRVARSRRRRDVDFPTYKVFQSPSPSYANSTTHHPRYHHCSSTPTSYTSLTSIFAREARLSPGLINALLKYKAADRLEPSELNAILCMILSGQGPHIKFETPLAKVFGYHPNNTFDSIPPEHYIVNEPGHKTSNNVIARR
ncbi:hypothetical protein F4801DRAFT_583444 [Xylaria longipes]|nr:hypothetical protein F4801DRAFT_583444 [Xylaria longipes]